MSLIIRKLGNKNFRHESPNYADYAANDIKAEFEGNIFKLRSFNGRIIFDREGYNFADVTLFVDGGAAETFVSVDALRARLINIGYPFAGGLTSIELESINGGTP